MQKFRDYNPEYYDAGESYAADIPFYLGLAKNTDEVLEIGSGTGRVSFPLAKKVKSLWGIDISDAMLKQANSKMKNDCNNITFTKEDMFNLHLNKKFNLIIAPFRVVQCCETDKQLTGLFKSIKDHLSPAGKCILNAFDPYLSKEEMGTKWINGASKFDSKHTLDNGDLLIASEERQKINTENQVLYTDLVYERFSGDKLVDKYINPIFMKYFYPSEFISKIQNHGFTILDKWGGYKNEVYGHGNELVVSFKNSK